MEALNELAAALAKAQAEMKGAAKDATNPHFKSRYADLASIWDAARGPLTKHGLSVVQIPGYDGEAKTASVTTILLHASGQSIQGTLHAPVQQDTAQGVGSALTYCRRYGLAAFVGVAPEDDDAEGSVDHSRPAVVERRPAHVASTGEIKLPGGPTKWDGFGGRPIADVPRKPLAAAYKWLSGRPGNEKLVAALEAELEREDRAVDRQLTAVQAGDFDEPPAALKGDLIEDGKDLPY